MRGRAALALIGTVLLCAAADAGAASDKHARERCAMRGVTVAENARARIYRLSPPGETDSYGCLKKTGRATRLAFEGGGGAHYDGQSFRLRGTRAAAVEQFCLDTDCSYEAHSIELRTGRPIRKVKRFALSIDLELGAGGSFAVIEQPDVEKAEYVVIAVDSGGFRLLDHGAAVDPHSLAVAGSTVYWTASGQPHSATLR